ncbi:hypothetical protein V1478_007756, partial [Vespula squamosa]
FIDVAGNVRKDKEKTRKREECDVRKTKASGRRKRVTIPRKTTASRIQFSPGEARMKLGKSQQGDKNSDRPSDAINCNSVVPGGAFAIVLREIPGPHDSRKRIALFKSQDYNDEKEHCFVHKADIGGVHRAD